jgi:dTDP-4-amino-4,6-dideoxygalactose transaminase
MRVPFADLRISNPSLASDCRDVLSQVMSDGEFILGRHVADFESDFAHYLGADYCVGVNSGTEALHLALRAYGVGSGDEVITTPLTWISTAWAITYCGALPVFVDVEPGSYTIDPGLVKKAITPRTKALLPVHLYGQSANLGALRELADRHGLAMIEDAAQAHGARYGGSRLGTLGEAGCFSFYPSKNLGAFGEAGAVVTNDPNLAQHVRRLRDHAQASRHWHVEVGYNARMEGIQGAILKTKLPYLDSWNEARRRIAEKYRDGLSCAPGVELPTADARENHVWHLYVVLVSDRDDMQAYLAGEGIETRIHYPTLVPFQPAYKDLAYRIGDFPIAENLAAKCLSLPIYPDMTEEMADFVIEKLRCRQYDGRKNVR